MIQNDLDLAGYSSMQCPLHGLVTILSGPWTTYILWLIRTRGDMRFGALKKQMPGISAKVLTERLRMLERVGILARHQENTVPLKVTYSLTARGKDLEKAIDSLDALALKWSGATSWAGQGRARSGSEPRLPVAPDAVSP